MAPQSRLREVVSASHDEPSPPPAREVRTTRTKRSMVIESESSEDDEEDEEDDEEELDEDSDEEDSDDDADGEADSDAEATMDIDPPRQPVGRPSAPKIAVSKPPPKPQARPVSQVPPKGALMSVEDKEMMESDEELSDLNDEDDAEGELEDEDEEMLDAGDEDAEGEDDEDGMADYERLTKRPRGRADLGNDFLQLPMEPQIRKIITEEEHAMRRAEMARRRKNLTEKKNEEEKRETINKLLKKQASKKRGKVAELPDQDDEEMEEVSVERANPLFTRWVSTAKGFSLGVPEEWKGKSVGAFAGSGWNVVEVVDAA